MKISSLAFIAVLVILLPSCATVFGGQKYNALVEVEDHPNAKIYYKGKKIGTGNAVVQLPRAQSNRLVFTLMEDGCPDQNISFTTRKVRGGVVVASIISDILWFPFIFNNIVDIATGAYFKPNDTDKMIVKNSHDSYSYNLNYSDCSKANIDKEEYVTEPKSKKDKLLELDQLLEEGLISEEEHKKSREEILAK